VAIYLFPIFNIHQINYLPDIHQILKQYWGYDSFRPLQEEIINSTLEGNDTLALMPTGGGKSLCYQVPALAKDGLCLVISPLIALMKDQVENLRKKNITAYAIFSGMSRNEVINTLTVATESNCKFLYVSPERLETKLFKEYLPGMHVNLIAVDEAHCISQWGYDFRPPYLRIASLREELPHVPVIALTASATKEVQEDICEKLTSPLTPLRQGRRGDAWTDRYPKYKIQQIEQFENARLNRKNSTEAEAALWHLLRNSKTGYKFRRQHPIDAFIVDFVCLEKGLIIEVDGGYHNNEQQKIFDEYRTEALKQKRFTLLRFTNEEVLADRYAVQKKIVEFIEVLDKNRSVAATSPFSISDGEGPGMRWWAVFRQSFERKNLSYSVFKIDSKINKVIEILNKVPGTAIVYCKSRKRTKEIADILRLQNISSDFYHAGLPQEERNKRQEDWIKNKIRVIVCTNAFGMGIDKPDVRAVVHADVPDCLENYYQEAGRAGRDGEKSYAVLLYDDHDITELEGMTAIRYPSMEEIRTVYQAVANYLQIPAGSGEGNYYDFDINDFIKKFKLNTHTAIYALKALEQDNWLALNEQVFISSKVKFTTTKEGLYEFEKTHPDLEPAIKALLRGYEGIFDFPASISETVLIRLLRKDVEEIKKDLRRLDQYGIIHYEPQVDTPQIFFTRNRVKAEDLTLNPELYNKRKEKFSARVRNIIRYVQEMVTCRSKMIGAYFGDTKLHNCNVCDNCFRQKKIHIDEKEFDKIRERIQTVLAPQPMPSKELLDKLASFKKEKAWTVIEFLQAEDKLEVDKAGWVRLK
jgi:superfamily II DNA helicase RecQ